MPAFQSAVYHNTPPCRQKSTGRQRAKAETAKDYRAGQSTATARDALLQEQRPPAMQTNYCTRHDGMRNNLPCKRKDPGGILQGLILSQSRYRAQTRLYRHPARIRSRA
jgi:hypothetical protein